MAYESVSSSGWLMLSADTGEVIDMVLSGDWATAKKPAEGDWGEPDVVTLATLVVQQSLNGLAEVGEFLCCWMGFWWRLWYCIWQLWLLLLLLLLLMLYLLLAGSCTVDVFTSAWS